MKVLFLTQWYPNRSDAMAGLFVRNHAEAVARQGIDVCVLYCHPVEKGFEVVEQTTNGVREIYVYHDSGALRALLRGRDEVLKRWGKPDLCQLNVLSKTALLAYDLYWRRGTPYILVEHWSGYLPVNGAYLRNNGPLQRRLYEFLARKAKCILPVSGVLKQAMQRCGIRNNRWQLIHNVVLDCFFEPLELFARLCRSSEASRRKEPFEPLELFAPFKPPVGPFRLLHVSCFDEKAKNIQGILKAIKLLEARRQDFQLTIIGSGQDFETDKAFAHELGLTPERVVFVGEKTPQEVYSYMQQSQLFVLFSRYENAPVVLSECMAVGLPVVASRVGGIPEMVNAETGLLVPSEDETALAEAIDRMMTERQTYRPEAIRNYGKQYSYENVGRQLKALYESVLS